ncbi:MAG: class I SAM-dependent methyltransferase [Candidatus Thorarchaeota archaeon]
MFRKIIKTSWNLLTKIPRLKKALNRFYAWRIFEIVPVLKKILYRFYDKFWYLELYIENNQQNLSHYLKSNIEIENKRLKYILPYQKNWNHNKEKNWEILEILEKIEDSIQFLFLKEHFLEEKNWKDIDFYNVITDQITSNSGTQEFSDINHFMQTLNCLDNLHKKFELDKVRNKIKVAIGSSGEFILIEGILFFSLLKILEINPVPVKIIYRHPQWKKIYNAFLKFKTIHGGIYQPLIHPDLNLEIYDSNSEKRFKIMRDNLDSNAGTLLDIGANLGFFCHKFEDIGFECYAVEVRPSNVYFMTKLRDIENKKFKIINKSIFDLKEPREYDIVIALNIFHHFLREQKLYSQLIEFLKNLRVSVMFFQPHDPLEDIMKNAYINFNNRQFVDFIIKNSCLNKSVLLNEKVDGKNRPIYKLIK